jgi:TonB-linked SusC/RagA family outer membrane protein
MPKPLSKCKWLVPILLVTVNALSAQGQLLTAFNKGKEEEPHATPKEQKIKSLVDILAQVKEQYQVNFHYDSELLASHVANPDLMQVPKSRLDESLGLLLKPLQLNFVKAGTDAYIITPAPALSGQQAQPAASPAARRVADVEIKGKVSSATGEALPGVTVVLKGTTIGTSTGADGSFSLSIPNNTGTLVFSFIGFQTKEVPVPKSGSLQVTLLDDTKALEEVVVIGYGTQKKTDLTGAVATVSAEKLKDKVAVSYGEALVGQVAGVQIQQTSGAPGNEGLSVRVRGTGSITAGMSPLYVIDGYPMESSAFALINPSDIESIQVLKDASSTAIYGSRGSNGVIIVTTKKGELGPPSFSYNTYVGVQQVAKKIDMMNSREYLEFFKDGHNQAWLDRAPMAGDPPHTIHDSNEMRSKYSNSSFYIIPESFNDPSNFGEVDWQDLIFRNAMMQRHELSVLGGAGNTRYSVSGSYTDQDGIEINSDYKRYNLRSSVTSQLTKKLEVGLNVSGYYSQANSLDNGKDSPLSYAIYLPPIYPLRNPDGTYGSQVRNPDIWAGDVANPIGIAENVTNFTSRNGLIASTYAQYDILEGLRYKISLNGSLENRRFKYYRPSFVDTDGSRAPKMPEPTASSSRRTRTPARARSTSASRSAVPVRSGRKM